VTDQILTAQRLKEVLHYDADTGQFTRLPANGRNGKHCVGTIHRGYLIIDISYKKYKAHRLAWLYVHGEWPNDQIDHINGDKVDNRISNLRAATPSQNKQNARKARSDSRSGLIGAIWSSRQNKWRAVIMVEGKYKQNRWMDGSKWQILQQK
jgi:citrate synthase